MGCLILLPILECLLFRASSTKFGLDEYLVGFHTQFIELGLWLGTEHSLPKQTKSVCVQAIEGFHPQYITELGDRSGVYWSR